METQKLTELYKQIFGTEPKKIEKLPASGSNRQYFRLDNVIGCVGTNAEENTAFFNLALEFAAHHLPVPTVYAISEDHSCYIQQDLGNKSLFDFLRSGRESGGEYDEPQVAMLRLVMSELPRFQMEGASEQIYSQCYPQKYFDERTVRFDLNYFKYNFLKLIGAEINEISLEDDFDRLCTDLLEVEEQGFMYRDFQARNIMLLNGQPYYIDFQGGRRGPIYYDVASFLWQASAHYSDSLRKQLIDTYLTSLGQYIDIDSTAFMQRLRIFVLFRSLQVLGAYGFRGLWEHKPHFFNSIPAALDNIKHIFEDKEIAERYPYIKEIILCQIHHRTFRRSESEKNSVHPVAPLTVRVFSFSYKSPEGIPADESGNGGGYVFDCRSTNNPGRYAEYKSLTGLDQPVIDFLEKDGEILTFLDSVYRLADFHVQRYIERGFTSLMFAFGCTGGQHRSVYSAQHLAEHIYNKFNVKVIVCHREQNILTTFGEALNGELSE